MLQTFPPYRELIPKLQHSSRIRRRVVEVEELRQDRIQRAMRLKGPYVGRKPEGSHRILRTCKVPERHGRQYDALELEREAVAERQRGGVVGRRGRPGRAQRHAAQRAAPAPRARAARPQRACAQRAHRTYHRFRVLCQ